jgi:hypothetical protein
LVCWKKVSAARCTVPQSGRYSREMMVSPRLLRMAKVLMALDCGGARPGG